MYQINFGYFMAIQTIIITYHRDLKLSQCMLVLFLFIIIIGFKILFDSYVIKMYFKILNFKIECKINHKFLSTILKK